jgi:hypothetical protein
MRALLRNPRTMAILASAMIIIGLLNGILGSASGWIVAICGLLILARQRFWPRYPRRPRKP